MRPGTRCGRPERWRIGLAYVPQFAIVRRLARLLVAQPLQDAGQEPGPGLDVILVVAAVKLGVALSPLLQFLFGYSAAARAPSVHPTWERRVSRHAPSVPRRTGVLVVPPAGLQPRGSGSRSIRESCPDRRAFNETRFDLPVTVRAEQNALRGFSAIRRERLSRRHRHVEQLRGRIDMMEREGEHAAVISAYRAAATSLLNQDPADLVMPSSDGLPDAPLASPVPSVFGEFRLAVPRTMSRVHRTNPGWGWWPTSALRSGPVL